MAGGPVSTTNLTLLVTGGGAGREGGEGGGYGSGRVVDKLSRSHVEKIFENFLSVSFIFSSWNGFDLMDTFDLSSRPQSVAEAEKHCRGYYWRPNRLFWLVTSCFTGIEMSGSVKKPRKTL